MQVLQSIVAVSYTHLDVYKRQYHSWVKPGANSSIQGYYGTTQSGLTVGTLTTVLSPTNTNTAKMRICAHDLYPTDGGVLSWKCDGFHLLIAEAECCLLYTSRCV